MKKLLIFDLDGTLLNTLTDLAAATNYALQRAGFATHDEKDYLKFIGNGIYKLFERALPPAARTAENITQIKDLFVPYYNQHGTDLTKPYEGIVPLLETLQKRGVQVAVASNKYQAATEQLVRYFFPTISFALVCGQQDGLPTKPHPFIVQEILRQTAIGAADTLYVGDSAVDIQTAKNAQVDACAVLWGFGEEKQLRSFQPSCVVSHPQEIFRIL